MVLLLVVTHFSWDVLRSQHSDLFYRVNALHLESEAQAALRDPVAILSILVFNLVTFGLSGVVGALLYPRRWWAAALALASIGATFWLLRFGPLFLVADSLSAKLASAIDLITMVSCALAGAWLSRRRTQEYSQAG